MGGNVSSNSCAWNGGGVYLTNGSVLICGGAVNGTPRGATFRLRLPGAARGAC